MGSEHTDDSEAALRLVTGMLEAIEQKPYASITISDVVRCARVSKRTFYEHFADKEACFVAAYEAASNELLKAIDAAAAAQDRWDQAIEAGVGIYLQMLEVNKPLARAFLLDIHTAGPRALAARRVVHGRFAAQLQSFVAEARDDDKSLRPLTDQLAAALVGGINELVLVSLEREAGADLAALQGAAAELVRAVVLRR